MARLIPLSPFDGLLPLTIGPWTLREAPIDRMWSVAPLAGQEEAVSRALPTGFPPPNRVLAEGGARAIWTGPGQALVTGDLPDLAGMAAVTDQSDAWAAARIEGPDVGEVLARLVPVDLAAEVFGAGHTARTLVGHMTASVTRAGPDAFEIMVMRSMAVTLHHELQRAMTGVAARRA